MERKVLTFLKGWMMKQRERCPKEKLDSFLLNELNVKERADAMVFIDQLIKQKWMQQIFENGREALAVFGYGAEMLKRLHV